MVVEKLSEVGYQEMMSLTRENWRGDLSSFVLRHIPEADIRLNPLPRYMEGSLEPKEESIDILWEMKVNDDIFSYGLHIRRDRVDIDELPRSKPLWFDVHVSSSQVAFGKDGSIESEIPYNPILRNIEMITIFEDGTLIFTNNNGISSIRLSLNDGIIETRKGNSILFFSPNFED